MGIQEGDERFAGQRNMKSCEQYADPIYPGPAQVKVVYCFVQALVGAVFCVQIFEKRRK